jgi:hypothetical protein
MNVQQYIGMAIAHFGTENVLIIYVYKTKMFPVLMVNS